MSELKPLRECPFCGGKALKCISPSNDIPYGVGCANPECQIYIGYGMKLYETEAEAIEAWNQRYERTESPNRMGILPCGAIWNGKAYCSKCGARVKGATDAD